MRIVPLALALLCFTGIQAQTCGTANTESKPNMELEAQNSEDISIGDALNAIRLPEIKDPETHHEEGTDYETKDLGPGNSQIAKTNWQNTFKKKQMIDERFPIGGIALDYHSVTRKAHTSITGENTNPSSLQKSGGIKIDYWNGERWAVQKVNADGGIELIEIDRIVTAKGEQMKRLFYESLEDEEPISMEEVGEYVISLNYSVKTTQADGSVKTQAFEVSKPLTPKELMANPELLSEGLWENNELEKMLEILSN